MTTVARPLPAHGERACYLRGCRQPECSAAHYRYMKRYRLERARGTTRRTNANPVAERARQLSTQGWSHRQIAAAANCSTRAITGLINNQYPTIEVGLAARILNAQPTVDISPPRTYVDATGTIRRVRALIALGHTLISIATAAGMTKTALGRVINHDRERLTAECARNIAATYIRLAVIPGPNTRARYRAARLGWPSPVAWGSDIDDPNAEPDLDTGDEPELGRDQLAALRRQEIEHLASYGIDEEEIAERVGLNKIYVRDILTELRTGVKRDRKKHVVAA